MDKDLNKYCEHCTQKLRVLKVVSPHGPQELCTDCYRRLVSEHPTTAEPMRPGRKPIVWTALLCLLLPVSAWAHLVTLSWNDNSTNETGFRIEKKSGADTTFAVIGSVGVNVVTFSDDVGPGTSATYRVIAQNAAGVSGPSNEATVTIPVEPPPPPPPPPPPGLSAPVLTITALAGQPVITWQLSTAAVGIHIARQAAHSNFVALADENASMLVYHDHKVLNAAAWCYRARFFTATADSEWSAPVCTQP